MTVGWLVGTDCCLAAVLCTIRVDVWKLHGQDPMMIRLGLCGCFSGGLCMGVPVVSWGSPRFSGCPWGSLNLPGARWGLGLAGPGALWGFLGVPGGSWVPWGSLGLRGALVGSLGLPGSLWGSLGFSEAR